MFSETGLSASCSISALNFVTNIGVTFTLLNYVNSLEASLVLFCGLLHEAVTILDYISSMVG